MDPDMHKAIMMAMRVIQGKKDIAPVEYYELCKCHEPDYSHPPKGISGRDLTTAAASGCLTCCIVTDALTTALDTSINETYNIVYKLKPDGCLKIRYMLNGNWDTVQRFQVYLCKSQSPLPAPLDTISSLREVHANPLSSDGVARMKEMLEYCKTHHVRCASTESPVLPTRVVQVGDANTLTRLLCTQGDRAEYVALSHCWGTEQNLTSTTATLTERLEGIPWDTLPNTFQDALNLARELGFAYIWIDSLCILQDDVKDWEKEGMKMGQIYENATLTVAASLSKSDKDGFFRPRSQYISQAFTVHHAALEGGSTNFRVRDLIKKHLRHDILGYIRDSWRANLIGPAPPMEPLDYRAWCFQEKLVSKRLLSFCGREVEWDCLSMADCECGKRRRDFETEGWDTRNGDTRQVYQSLKQDFPGAFHTDMTGGNSRDMSMELAHFMHGRIRKDRVEPRVEQSPEEKRRHAWLLWRASLVPAYSQLRLTKDMDRLPALSAVARGLEPICGAGEYVAGMWLSDFEVSVAWKAGAFGTNGPQPGRECLQTRAPSWSWASIEGPVDFCYDYEDEYRPIADLNDVRYSLASGDPFSNVAIAIAQVKGHLIPGTLRVAKLSPENVSSDDMRSVSYSCVVGDASFYVLPDTPLAQSGTFVRRTVLKAGQSQEEVDCPVQLLAILLARPRRLTGFEDTSDVPTEEIAAKQLITLLVVARLDGETEMYTRIGLIGSVKASLLSSGEHKWFEHWPIREIFIA